MKSASRVIVPDVADSPLFSNAQCLEVMLDAGVRSVQSTPLIAKSGRIWGVLSTHYRSVRHFGEGDLRVIDYFAVWAAEVLDLQFRADTSSDKTVFSGKGNGTQISPGAFAQRA